MIACRVRQVVGEQYDQFNDGMRRKDEAGEGTQMLSQRPDRIILASLRGRSRGSVAGRRLRYDGVRRFVAGGE